MTSSRLASDGRIDRKRRLDVTFDGRPLDAHPGDTLASALLASGGHDRRALGGPRSTARHHERLVRGTQRHRPNRKAVSGADAHRDHRRSHGRSGGRQHLRAGPTGRYRRSAFLRCDSPSLRSRRGGGRAGRTVCGPHRGTQRPTGAFDRRPPRTRRVTADQGRDQLGRRSRRSNCWHCPTCCTCNAPPSPGTTTTTS